MRSLLLEDVAAPPALRERRTGALLASAALHAVVVVSAVVLAQRAGTGPTDPAAAAERPMQLLYMPAPEAAPARAVLPEAPADRAPEPPPSRPAAPPADPVPDHEQPAGASTPPADVPPAQPSGVDEGASDEEPREVTTAPSAAELMASEAQRIFGGRSRSTTRPGGPTASPGLEVYVPPQPDACGALPPRNRGEPVELVTVSGRVYREGTRIPLPGAHLQMIGTPYVTFSSNDGSYELRFDPALVDRCRTQYVRVTAPGFRAQTLVLYLGPAAANDIPMSRR